MSRVETKRLRATCELLDSATPSPWHVKCNHSSVTELQTVSTMGPAAAWLQAPAGPLYSFVPAGGGPQCGALIGELVEAMRSHLSSETDGPAVLLADFSGDVNARVEPRPCTVTCADLSQADDSRAAFTLRLSEAVFVIAATDETAIECARQHAVWLRGILRDDNAGLVLLPVDGGTPVARAEEIIGLPVCSVIRGADDVRQLAAWIALN